MAILYANLCEAGERTCINAEGIKPVPNKWLAGTIVELKARGREDLVPAE